MDRGGFRHRVRQAAAAGFDSCDAGGGDESAFAFFEMLFGSVEQPEVGFDVVEETSLKSSVSLGFQIDLHGVKG